jgi:hypothetical protein
MEVSMPVYSPHGESTIPHVPFFLMLFEGHTLEEFRRNLNARVMSKFLF